MTDTNNNFDHAMLRMLNSGIDAGGLHQVFKHLKEAADTSESESAALTLGFSDDEVLVAGDYVPTMTLSLVKISEQHAKESEEHHEARTRAKDEVIKEYKESVLEGMKECPEMPLDTPDTE